MKFTVINKKQATYRLYTTELCPLDDVYMEKINPQKCIMPLDPVSASVQSMKEEKLSRRAIEIYEKMPLPTDPFLQIAAYGYIPSTKLIDHNDIPDEPNYIPF